MQTAFIGYIVSKFKIYNAFIKYINSQNLEYSTLFDLCSGSGEPAISIFKASQSFDQLILSDKYPNTKLAFNDQVKYINESIDVNEFKFKSNVTYTMFNAFHHFSDKKKEDIVQCIIESKTDAYFVEILRPNLFCLIQVLITTTLGCLVITPFLPSFNFKTFVFTYILPINLISITFDGIVSVFKSRSLKQYQNMTSQFSNKVEVFKLGPLLAPLIVIRIKK
ncbi:MAG: hypothetical protein R2852_04105 [Bacteroidia bacterium]